MILSNLWVIVRITVMKFQAVRTPAHTLNAAPCCQLKNVESGSKSRKEENYAIYHSCAMKIKLLRYLPTISVLYFNTATWSTL